MYGIRTFGDDVQGSTRGGNIIYRFTLDRLRVCHLGHLSHVPASSHISAIGDTDVLLLRARDDSVQPSVAAEPVSLVDPKLVIPVSDWPHEGAASPMGRFLKDLGVSPPSPVPNLTVTSPPPCATRTASLPSTAPPSSSSQAAPAACNSRAVLGPTQGPTQGPLTPIGVHPSST